MKFANLRLSALGLAALLTACNSTQPVEKTFVNLHARLETTPVVSNDDAADDPAIWVNRSDPQASRILGTDKHNGLMVYNLQGEQIQSLNRGRLNNVDLRQGIVLDGRDVSLAVATNRSNMTLDIFSITDDGTVQFLQDQAITLSDPYGICMHQDRQGQAHVFVNSKDAEYQHWILNPQGMLAPMLAHSFRLKSQPEGCAVDDLTGTLYMGEEEYGIWVLPIAELANATTAMSLLDHVDSPYLRADVEGMDIYRKEQEVYLLVSSQGNNSYALYDLNIGSGKYLGSFRLTDDAATGVDGTEETDGLAVSSAWLGDDYPDGMVVIQDGYNRMPAQHQNFKVLSWTQVQEALLAGE